MQSLGGCFPSPGVVTLHCCPHLRVLRVSLMLMSAGLQQATMRVRLLPPRACLSTRVSTWSRYGTCVRFTSHRASITWGRGGGAGDGQGKVRIQIRIRSRICGRIQPRIWTRIHIRI